tara:strand:+ start:189 stop:929 length:741 start_codon:yes stop_codon:yes gene_type:complete
MIAQPSFAQNSCINLFDIATEKLLRIPGIHQTLLFVHDRTLPRIKNNVDHEGWYNSYYHLEDWGKRTQTLEVVEKTWTGRGISENKKYALFEKSLPVIRWVERQNSLKTHYSRPGKSIKEIKSYFNDSKTSIFVQASTDDFNIWAVAYVQEGNTPQTWTLDLVYDASHPKGGRAAQHLLEGIISRYLKEPGSELHWDRFGHTLFEYKPEYLFWSIPTQRILTMEEKAIHPPYLSQVTYKGPYKKLK